MEFMYNIMFSVFEAPNVKLRKPSWLQYPSPMTVFALIMVSYFLVTGGIIYDIINEPPSIGQTTDARGNPKMQAFMAGRVNGQYIMEGLGAAFMFVLGAFGFILLDQTHKPHMHKLNRYMMLCVSFACILISLFCMRLFMSIKMPGYMH